MLSPLAVSMAVMVITCSMSLLICWAYDIHRAEIEAGRSRPADLEFRIHHRTGRSQLRFPAPGLLQSGRRAPALRPRLKLSKGVHP
jgi:hypothetical protein